MKLRILFCTEASILSTGYATYAREMISRLHATGKYEIAEFGCYVRSDDPRVKSIPWKFYGNLPVNDEEAKQYNGQGIDVFGAWKFDRVVLDFMPHVVFSYRDFWMDEHQLRSPLRHCFHLIWMPTVDAYPQSKQWIAGHEECDAIFTYTDWAADILRKQTANKINPIASLTAGADQRIKPVQSKIAHKAKYGLAEKNIVGTVMRNQRRKLFPDLFSAFSKFLEVSGRQDTLLYCHTSYPDKHPWNIPELLNEYNLSSKILFTYKCGNCQYEFPSFFNDISTICPRCHSPQATTANVQKGCSVEFMNEIYNLFDFYVQYANSEGQGLPAWEAAACGIPLAVVGYSGMMDAVKYCGAYQIPVKALVRELETGCYRAVPNNESLTNLLNDFFSAGQETRDKVSKKVYEAYQKNCGYDKAANRLMNYLDTLSADNLNQKWFQQPQILEPSGPPQQELSNSDFATYLVANVLRRPDRIGSYMHARLIKDINFGYTTGGMGGYYLNEDSMWFNESKPEPFEREKAFEHFTQLRHYMNHWEQQRMERINVKTR